MHEYAAALGHEAGFYQRCIDADVSIIKETLAGLVSLESDIGQATINQLDREFEDSRRAVSRRECSKTGRAEHIRNRVEETEQRRKDMACMMAWEYGGSWKENQRVKGFVRGTGSYLDWLEKCERNSV
jgi:hypothetical protein